MALKSPLLIIIIIPLFFFPLFSSPVFSLSHPPLGLLMEEKTRLGSTPPSCYNKCNQCHPCTPVKVPIFPSFNRVQAPATRQSTGGKASFVAVPEFDSFSGGDNSKYSDYKPLGWKCRCKDHLYNP